MTYHRVCNKSNMTGSTSGTGTASPSGALELTSPLPPHVFSEAPVAQFLVFCVVLRGSLFFFLFFFSLTIVFSAACPQVFSSGGTCTLLPSFLGVHPNFWGYKENELHFLHARSCTVMLFVNITGFNSNSSSDWTIKK